VPILVPVENLEKIEFNVTTAEGASRVTIVTGTMRVNFGAASDGEPIIHDATVKALLDPTLTPGQFRKATSMVSVSTLSQFIETASTRTQWSIDDSQATFDDETGRVQLLVDLHSEVSGNNNVQIFRIKFQVTTLAKV
jgi:hypothetical protein